MILRFPSQAVVSMGLGFLALFGLLAARVATGDPISWDQELLRSLDHSIPGAQNLVRPSVVVAPLVALAATFVLVRSRRFAAACLWICAVGGVLALDPLLKHLIGRPPLHGSSGYSFPSGSAMVSAAALGALFLTMRTARRPIAAVLGALLVVAQGGILVATGWHYPSDVVGGWLIAICWLAAVSVVVSSGANRYDPEWRRAQRARDAFMSPDDVDAHARSD